MRQAATKYLSTKLLYDYVQFILFNSAKPFLSLMLPFSVAYKIDETRFIWCQDNYIKTISFNQYLNCLYSHLVSCEMYLLGGLIKQRWLAISRSIYVSTCLLFHTKCIHLGILFRAMMDSRWSIFSQ